MDWSSWLLSAAWPVVSRVLVALGLGTVTFTGANAALDTLLSASKTAAAGLGAEVLQVLAMGGFFDAMSITAGGLVGSLGWLAMKRFALQSSGS